MERNIFTYHSPLGLMVGECGTAALKGLRFADADDGQRNLGEAPDGLCRAVCCWLDEYFGGHAPSALPPIDLQGTAFQVRVWQELLHVPHGHTVSYGDLAQRLNRSSGESLQGRVSARAVGNAVGRNPIALMVPCHRVVGSDGSLTGYAYGIDRKRALLQMERAGCQLGPVV